MNSKMEESVEKRTPSTVESFQKILSAAGHARTLYFDECDQSP
jgi:hypothetical protein